MATVEEVEEAFQVGFEHVKKFEVLAQKQEVPFPIHLERIQALQYLVNRLEVLKAFELAELETAAVEEEPAVIEVS